MKRACRIKSRQTNERLSILHGPLLLYRKAVKANLFFFQFSLIEDVIDMLYSSLSLARPPSEVSL